MAFCHVVKDSISYTNMLILRPYQNVRECPKEAVTISLYASHTMHVWTCEGDSGSSLSYWCLCTIKLILEAQLLACTLRPLYIYRVEIERSSSRFFCTCNTTVFIIPSRCGVDLDLFCTWGHSFVSTSELFLSSRDMWHIIERKVWSMGFLRWFTSTRELTLTLMDWRSKAVRNGPSSHL